VSDADFKHEPLESDSARFGFDGLNEATPQASRPAIRANVEALQFAIVRMKNERATAQQAVIAAHGEEDDVVAFKVEGADACRLIRIELVEVSVALCEKRRDFGPCRRLYREAQVIRLHEHPPRPGVECGNADIPRQIEGAVSALV
jgi:hypothetical protein